MTPVLDISSPFFFMIVYTVQIFFMYKKSFLKYIEYREYIFFVVICTLSAVVCIVFSHFYPFCEHTAAALHVQGDTTLTERAESSAAIIPSYAVV